MVESGSSITERKSVGSSRLGWKFGEVLEQQGTDISPAECISEHRARNPKVVAVLGAQWGDEGKGKLVDMLAEGADICARFNGGNNAGHVMVANGKKHTAHLVPCGCLWPHTTNMIGNGMVIHLKSLIEELDSLKVVRPDIVSSLVISSRAHLLFDIHRQIDKVQEQRKAKDGAAIGTTLCGIGPCYFTKVSRCGIRVGELLNFEHFEMRFRRFLSEMLHLFPELKTDGEDEIARHKEYFKIIGPCIVDTLSMIDQALIQKRNILIEGANATLLDIDMGTYPYTTSSSTTIGGIGNGLGISPRKIDCVIGVVKAYTTRVGGGPFPTELQCEVGEQLRTNGFEVGSTTGRSRRCGWLDIPLIKLACTVNGFDFICLTKLDVLAGIFPLRICIKYRHIISGEELETPPTNAEEFQYVEPVYENMEGWDEPLYGCKLFEDLPLRAQAYVSRIEELIGVACVWIGTGSDREDIIYKF